MAACFEAHAPSSFERHCGAAWLRAGSESMPRRVSRDSELGDDARASSSDDEDGVFGARPPPFVEGSVSVLARCRPRDRRCARLAWRLAFFSVDLRDGALRVFRSDDERRAWHALGPRHGANLAKWTAVIGARHAVTPVADRTAESRPLSIRRGRAVARLAGVAEDAEVGDDAGGGSPDDAGARAADALYRTRAYCTFEVWEGAAGAASAPLLKFAADPARRGDLDVLHDALEAIALSSQCHVVEP